MSTKQTKIMKVLEQLAQACTLRQGHTAGPAWVDDLL